MANPSQLTFELVTPDHGVVSELVDEDGGTRVTVTSASHGPLGFAYRLVMRPRTQALIHTRMLNALSASFADA